MSNYAWVITTDHLDNMPACVTGPRDATDEQIALAHEKGTRFKASCTIRAASGRMALTAMTISGRLMITARRMPEQRKFVTAMPAGNTSRSDRDSGGLYGARPVSLSASERATHNDYAYERSRHVHDYPGRA